MRETSCSEENAAENYSEFKFCHLGSHPFFVLDRAKTLSGKSEIALYYKRWKLSTVFFLFRGCQNP